MRTALLGLALAVAACDPIEGAFTSQQEMPETIRPADAPPETGILVQRWQLRAEGCSETVKVLLFSEGVTPWLIPLHDGDLYYWPMQCMAGEPVCFGAWTEPSKSKTWGAGETRQPGDAWCVPCSSGWRAVTLLRCQ